MPNKKAAGRPTKINKEWAEDAAKKIPDMYKQGMSTAQVVAKLGTCWTSWTKALGLSPGLMEAKKNGDKAALAYFENIAMDAMLGNLPGFNATVWIFSMKNRFGWRDKHELTGKGQGPIQVQAETYNVGELSIEERKQLRSLLAKSRSTGQKPS